MGKAVRDGQRRIGEDKKRKKTKEVAKKKEERGTS